MSYTLTLTPGTPFKEGPHSSNGSNHSLHSSNIVQRRRPRDTSLNSLISLTSLLSPTCLRQEEPSIGSTLISPTRARGLISSTPKDRRSLSACTSSFGVSPQPSFFSALSDTRNRDDGKSANHNPYFDTHNAIAGYRQNDDVRSVCQNPSSLEQLERIDSTMSPDELLTPPLPNLHRVPTTEHTIEQQDYEQDSVASLEPTAFSRWMSTLRRRRQKTRPPTVTPRRQRWVMDDFDERSKSSPRPQQQRHRKSSSQSSSLGFMSAVKSATVTIASTSIAPLSKRTLGFRRGQQRSSILSGSETRPSMDSERSMLDEAAKQRSRKRREKLEELIRTEESYIADVKALSNAYFTLLGQYLPSTGFTRAAAQRNIAEILHLHDELLADLHRIVPFATHDQTLTSTMAAPPIRKHTRWHSVDVVPSRANTVRSAVASIRKGRRSLNINRSSDEEAAVPRCSPQTVAAVSNAFSSRLNRFKIYEEFGSNFEMMQKDIEETQQIITRWPEYDKAIEALSITIGAAKDRAANHKKALTVKDLLIKPVQRIMRYELLFNDLCKLTPVCDDPDVHGQLVDLMAALNKTCQGVNHAKDNPTYTRALEASWLIGERLNFSDQVPRSIFLTLLGQVVLCGCLHVAYRSRDRIRGSYVLCILFETTLLLASVGDDGTRYSVLVGISLANATIEECDNGKALQCHTALHSWKVIFEHDARMYEVILTACSAKEAEAWRKRLSLNIALRAKAVAEGSGNPLELHSPLLSEMRSIGKAFGKPGSFVRRMSVHRTATVGPLTDLNQVILKNTLAVKETPDSSNPAPSVNASTSSLQIPRSQSVATPSHVQTLAPRRADRIRLETLLTDVWSKDQLPYPGMIPRRSDHPLRAGANHVIRKFSMASITSNFSSSKRTGSFASVASSARTKEDMPPPGAASSRGYKRAAKSSASGRALPLVDFHNAPDAFLPPDFELAGGVAKEAKRKKSALRTLTLTMERPFSPLLGNERGGLRRAQSVRDVRETEGSEATVRIPAAGREGSGSGRGSGNLAALPIGLGGAERAKTPVPQRSEVQRSEETVASCASEEEVKTPRKIKSRHKLMRLFGQ